MIKRNGNPVTIGDTTYRSIMEASKSLGLNTWTIRSAALYGNTINGQKVSTKYPIVDKKYEKTHNTSENSPVKVYSAPKKGKAIMIDGKVYKSIAHAARYYNVHPVSMGAAAKKGMFRKMKVEVVGNQINQTETIAAPITEKKTSTHLRDGVCVICTTTGKKYKSIRAASKELGISAWTLGLKMQVAGKFIDKEGNVYVRTVPMNTKNNYTTSSASLSRVVTKKRSNTKTKANTSIKTVQDDSTLSPIEKVKQTDVALFTDICKEMAIKLVNENRISDAYKVLEFIK